MSGGQEPVPSAWCRPGCCCPFGGRSSSATTRPASRRRARPGRRVGRDIADGLRFLWRHPLVRPLTLLGFGNSLTGGAVIGLLVVYGVQGRVNVTARMIAWGGTPFGAALGGVIAQLAGIRVAYLVMAAGVAASTVLGWSSHRSCAGGWARPSGHSSGVTMSRRRSALSGVQPGGWRTVAQPSTNSRV